MSKYHYFATHALGCATADTREGAIEKLLRGLNLGRAGDLRTIVANCHKAGDPGLYVWTIKVVGAEPGSYTIEWFAPKGVEVEEPREHYLTYFTKKKFAIWHVPPEVSVAMKKAKKEAA